MNRKRTNACHYSAEDQALSAISREAESRLAETRAARAEAREIRIKELERCRKEMEEKEELVAESETLMRACTQTATSPSEIRRASDDYTGHCAVDGVSKDRDFKAEVRLLEEKYRAAMLSSAQLDNEKQSLVYLVDLLKDQLSEHMETHIELCREHKDKCREFVTKKRELLAAQATIESLREQNKNKDRLIAESGLTIVGSETGDLLLESSGAGATTYSDPATCGVLLSPEAVEFLNKASKGPIDDKIKAVAVERKKMVEEILRLERLLDEQTRHRKSDSTAHIPQMNGPEMQLYEVQREASKQIHDYKIKLQKADQDIATLEGTVIRLDTQVKRYKADAELAESMEDILKQEKRKLLKEVREAHVQVEELTNQNKHLATRLERIKQSRIALSIQ